MEKVEKKVEKMKTVIIPISEKAIFTAKLQPSNIAETTFSRVSFINPAIIDMLIKKKNM